MINQNLVKNVVLDGFFSGSQQTILMKYHALFVILKKRLNLKLSSAANYRWRFKG